MRLEPRSAEFRQAARECCALSLALSLLPGRLLPERSLCVCLPVCVRVYICLFVCACMCVSVCVRVAGACPPPPRSPVPHAHVGVSAAEAVGSEPRVALCGLEETGSLCPHGVRWLTESPRADPGREAAALRTCSAGGAAETRRSLLLPLSWSRAGGAVVQGAVPGRERARLWD